MRGGNAVSGSPQHCRVCNNKAHRRCLEAKGNPVMSIRTRILIIISLAMVSLAAIVVFNALQVRANLMAEKKLQTRHLVETAYGVLDFWYAKQMTGAIDEETAKREAAAAIKTMRYAGKEYFFITDFTTPVPKMVMHPTVPTLDGKVLDSEKFNCATSMQAGEDGPVVSTDGKKNFFVAFNEVANKAGSGYVTYDWPKPVAGGGATKELYPKMSYVKKFDSWNWLIGAGIYIDDVSDVVVARLVRDTAIAGGIAILLLVLSIWQTRCIVRPLAAAEAASRAAVGGNDFTHSVPVSGDDEVGRVSAAFNEIMAKLQAIINEIRRSADAIAGAAGGIAKSAGEIVGNTEQQSTAASATAAAIEQISASLSETTANAAESEKSAESAAEDAGRALVVTRDNVLGMEGVASASRTATEEVRKLSENSSKISGIVGVIKEIADQTNLLALNAAIEAARAGEQGRGFAVVADEVRKLAERTANSTQEIGKLIDLIQAQIQQAVGAMETVDHQAGAGAESARKTEAELEHIAANSEHAGERARGIAHSVREQDSAVQEIARQVEAIARMTEKATVSANHNNVTAEELLGLAAALRTAVAQYKV